MPTSWLFSQSMEHLMLDYTLRLLSEFDSKIKSNLENGNDFKLNLLKKKPK